MKFYQYRAKVQNVVDGDTFDAYIDLGFEQYAIERVRTRGIDAREIHFVRHDSEEYQRGMKHAKFLEEWINESRREWDGDWPFVLESIDYNRGLYGRVIGDIYSRAKEEWSADALLNEFEDVERY